MQSSVPRPFDESLIFRSCKDFADRAVYSDDSDAETLYDQQLPIKVIFGSQSQQTPKALNSKQSINSEEEVTLLRSQVECLENALHSLLIQGRGSKQT